jgi:hypothetical protein
MGGFEDGQIRYEEIMRYFADKKSEILTEAMEEGKSDDFIEKELEELVNELEKEFDEAKQDLED